MSISAVEFYSNLKQHPKCPYCYQVFPRLHALHIHLKKHHQESLRDWLFRVNPNYCDSCGKLITGRPKDVYARICCSLSCKGKKLQKESRLKTDLFIKQAGQRKCKCGCGATIRLTRLHYQQKKTIPSYLAGHYVKTDVGKQMLSRVHKNKIGWNKGKVGCFSEDSIRKMSEAKKGKPSTFKGRRHTKEALIKMSEGLRGKTPWNKGKTGYFSEEVIARLKERMFGDKNPMRKNPPTPEAIENLRKKLKGRVFTQSTIEKMRLKKIGVYDGKKNPNWKGGISFEPYGFDFNADLRLQVKKRDNHTCKVCGTPVDKLSRSLHTHHIDYNKKNNQLSNLITLCEQCHTKTNFNREWWTNYFNDMGTDTSYHRSGQDEKSAEERIVSAYCL